MSGKPNIWLTYKKGYSGTPRESNRGVRPHGKANGLPLTVQEIISSLVHNNKKHIPILNLSFIRFEISIELSKYFNLKVFIRLSNFCDHKFTTKIEVSVIMTNGESVKDMTSKFDKLSENEILETTRKRMKWENDDYICSGHILNGMSDSLFDIYQNAESAKALWEFLESKYMAEDASATKFLVSSFMNYKEVDTRPVMEQYHEMLRILGQYTQHNLMMDEAISVATGHMKKDCRSHKGNDGAGSNGSKDPEKQQ
nr:putative zinc finger, CCHC-type [Tanacetum cinerariifolium]